MKLISFIATALLATSAFAGTSYIHDYDAALRGIELSNACITASDVKTIKAVKACTNLVPVTHNPGTDYEYTEWVCKKWETTHQSYPRAFDRTVCLEYGPGGEGYAGCVQTGVKQDFLPETIKVRVVTENGEWSDYPGVSKKFTFPACK